MVNPPLTCAPARSDGREEVTPPSEELMVQKVPERVVLLRGQDLQRHLSRPAEIRVVIPGPLHIAAWSPLILLHTLAHPPSVHVLSASTGPTRRPPCPARRPRASPFLFMWCNMVAMVPPVRQRNRPFHPFPNLGTISLAPHGVGGVPVCWRRHFVSASEGMAPPFRERFRRLTTGGRRGQEHSSDAAHAAPAHTAPAVAHCIGGPSCPPPGKITAFGASFWDSGPRAGFGETRGDGLSSSPGFCGDAKSRFTIFKRKSKIGTAEVARWRVAITTPCRSSPLPRA